MKNKILFYFILFFFSVSSSVNSQITVSPEIGLSYLPFKLYPFNSYNSINPRKPNILLGISAQMPIHKKWNTKLRISYTDRNDVEWTEFGAWYPGCDHEWKHQELNIDLNFNYQLSENISVGMGPSLIRYFAEFSNIERDGEGHNRGFKGNKFFFGLNAGISLEIKRVSVNLLYLRTRKYNGGNSWRIPHGDNRIDLTIGYRFGKNKR